MPRPSLRQAREPVRTFCEQHGITYHETGFFASYGQVLRHLHTVGGALRPELEYQASKKLAQAASVMAADPAALQLRLLQTVVEVAAEKNSTLVMPFPVELLRFFDRTSLPAARGTEPARAEEAIAPPLHPRTPAGKPASTAAITAPNGTPAADLAD